MATTAASSTAPPAVEGGAANQGDQSGDGNESKVYVGKLSYVLSKDDLSSITSKIGNIIEAQVILRGENELGYGHVVFRSEGEATDGADISGNATLRSRNKKSGRGREKTRAARGRGNGRVRRSADDVDGDGGDADADAAPTSEAAAQNGQVSITAVTEGVKELNVDGAKRGRGGKAGRGAARAPRPKRERGEPSKTLLFIRNLPYNFSQEALASLFSEHNLSYQSLSIPVRKFGPFKGKSRGFAFANVENEEAQKKVIEALDGKEVTGAGSNETAAAPAEGEAASGPRKFKLVVRQGYEADLKQPENEGEEGGAGAAGPKDSGTAETPAAAQTA